MRSKIILVLAFFVLSTCAYALEDPSYGTIYYLNRLFHTGFTIDNELAYVADYSLRFNYAGVQVASISGNKFAIDRQFFVPLPVSEPFYLTARYTELSLLEKQELHNIYEFGYRILPSLGFGIIGEPTFDKSSIDVGYSARFSLFNNYFIAQYWTLDYLYNEKTESQNYYKKYPRKYVLNWLYRTRGLIGLVHYSSLKAGEFVARSEPSGQQRLSNEENNVTIFLKNKTDMYTGGFLLDYLDEQEQREPGVDQESNLLIVRPFIQVPILPGMSIDTTGMYVSTYFKDGKTGNNSNSYWGLMTLLTHQLMPVIDLQYGYAFLQSQKHTEKSRSKVILTAKFQFTGNFYLKILHSVRPRQGWGSWDGSAVECSYVF